MCGKQFGIIAFNGGGIDDQINVFGEIFFFLSVKYVYTAVFQHTGQIGRGTVGTRYRKALREKDLRETAHTDTADSDEVDADRFVKINLVHGVSPFYSFY